MKLAILFLVFLACACAKLPSYIEPCPRNSNLTDCILRNVETLRPHLKNGVADLSLPPFELYFIPKIGVSKDGYTFDIVNITYKSFEHFQIRRLDLDLDAATLDLEVRFSDLICWGTYSLLGRMAGQSFNSSGNFLAKCVNFVLRERMQGEYVEVDGKRYLHLRAGSFEYEMPDGGFAYVEGVYPGEPRKSLLFNVEMNDHFVEFFRANDPFLRNGYEPEIVRPFVGVFAQYPIDELFP